MRGYLTITLFCTLLLPSLGLAGDYTVNPGQMGYNALPSIPNADPEIGRDIMIEISGATQFSDWGFNDEVDFTPYFKLTIPFREIAAIEFDGTPMEFWRVSPDRQDETGATRSSGIAPGDIRFGARFLIFRETGPWPAFGVRFVTKTTTGKDFEDHRFTNAPAYIIDALFAKTIFQSEGFLSKLRVLAKLGFTAWQQGSAQQNDAPDYGATLQAVFSSGLRTELEFRGYTGWQQGDKPHVLGFSLYYPTKYFDFGVTMNKGMTRESPPWELRAGFIIHFEVPYLQKPSRRVDLRVN